MKSALLSFLLIVCGIPIYSQQAVSASGGSASGSNGSVSYSVGQVVYSNQSGSNGSSLQGVQQPYEISVETSIEEARNISLEFIVFPNPCSDYISVRYELKDDSDVTIAVCSIFGVASKSRFSLSAVRWTWTSPSDNVFHDIHLKI